jgi:UDP-N-acetylmuramate: L-alanyl-gamma-D-glutamyl-meso-diaminopimelate ligase
MTGAFNVSNALAAIGIAARLGVTKEQVEAGFASFLGVKRRMEVIADAGGVTVIDDFAHHPTAIRETLRALAARYPGRRIWALFEPRSNTTTRNIFQHELAEAFDDAAIVIIGAVNRPERYRPEELLDIPALIASLRREGRDAMHLPDPADMTRYVLENARAGDVIALLTNGSFGGARQEIAEGISKSEG